MARAIRLAHLGDIHVQDRRRDEYAEVFDKLYGLLAAERPDVIVVAGDVFDSKTKASAHNLVDVAALLTKLCAVAPVVLIAGNHDTNVRTPGATDLLTPVIANNAALRPPRLTYFRASGVYAAHGIVWTVVATDGPKVPVTDLEKGAAELVAAGHVKADAPRICLFHEEVDGAAMPNDAVARGRLRVGDFAPYDAALGGHIHRIQGGARWAYCGSLLQQNIGEPHVGHGFTIWELSGSTKHEPYRTVPPVRRQVVVPNRFGFLRVKLVADADVTEEPRPTQPYYYEMHRDEKTADDVVASATAAALKKYGFPPRAVRVGDPASGAATFAAPEKGSAGGMSSARSAALSPDAHEAIIRLILGKDPLVDDVIALHRSKAEVSVKSRSRPRLRRFEFSNLYCYGPGNAVDFGELEGGAGGLVARNFAGKSAFIDALAYALYDVCPRGGTKASVTNSAAASYRLRLEFELDGKVGVIEKSGVAGGKNSKQSTYEFTFGGETLTQGDAKSTGAEIRKIVGEHSNAALTAFAHQHSAADFARMTSADRKRAVAKLLAFGSFDELEKSMKKENYAQNAVVTALKTQLAWDGKSPDGVVADVEKKRQECTKKIADLSARSAELDKLLVDANNRRRELEVKIATLSDRTRVATSNVFDAATAVPKDDMHRWLTTAGVTNDADVLSALARVDATAEAAGVSIDASETETPAAIDWSAIRKIREDLDASRTRVERLEQKVGTDADVADVDVCVEPAFPRPTVETQWDLSGRTPCDTRPSPKDVEAARIRAATHPPLATAKQKLQALGSRPALQSLVAKDGDAALAEQTASMQLQHEAALGEVIKHSRSLEFKIYVDPGIYSDVYDREKLDDLLDPSVDEKNVEAAVAASTRERRKFESVSAAGALREFVSFAPECKCCAANERLLGGTLDADSREVIQLEESVRQLRRIFVANVLHAWRLQRDALVSTEAKLRARAAECAAAKARLDGDKRRMQQNEVRSRYDTAAQPYAAAIKDHALLAQASYWWWRDKLEWDAYDAQVARRERSLAQKAERAELLDEQAKYAETRDRLAAMLGAFRSTLARLGRTFEDYVRSAVDKTVARLEQVRGQADAIRAEETGLKDEADANARLKLAETRRLVVLEEKAKLASRLAAEDRKARILHAYRRVLRPADGIASYLLARARGAIESTIKQSLAETGAKFTVQLDDEFELLVATNGGAYLPVAHASGYQQFIVGLACRVALWQLSEVPLPDCLFIDEGFGCCDEDNLASVTDFLESLASMRGAPRLLVAVSHLEAMKNRFDKMLLIESTPAGSRVCNVPDYTFKRPPTSRTESKRAITAKIGVVKPVAIGIGKPAVIGAGKPVAIGAGKPASIGVVKPPAIGVVKPPAIGVVKPPAIGVVKPSAIGVVKPAAIGAVKAPAVAVAKPTAVGVVKQATSVSAQTPVLPAGHILTETL
jgi:DNA repair exonuclease SbcCD ATPase subunit/DNA repair exonuclease SbcCD nuclease subunit